jgi:hypothetical protein
VKLMVKLLCCLAVNWFFLIVLQTLNQQKKREDEAIMLLDRICAKIHLKSACDYSIKAKAASSSTSHCSCSNPEKQLLTMVSSPLVHRICSYLSNDSGSVFLFIHLVF